MTPEVEKLLQTALKHKQGGSDKIYKQAYKAVDDIGKLGRKKKHQPAAVEALLKIIDEGVHPLPGSAASELADVATEANRDLVPYCRRRLHEDALAFSCVRLLLKFLGKEAFPDAAQAALDESLDIYTRYWVLETLDEEYGFEFTEGMMDGLPSLAGMTADRFRPDEIREWVAAGCPEHVVVPIKIPTAQLKKERIPLPAEYLKFLESHRAKTEYEHNECCWRLTEANDLFSPTNVDGREYPSIRQLRGFAETLKDMVEDEATVDQKGKPYPLSRLAAGWAIGASDSGDVLYLDPADECGVWAYHPDGGDVEKVAKAFRTWRSKARKV